jgi:hypothetical protein
LSSWGDHILWIVPALLFLELSPYVGVMGLEMTLKGCCARFWTIIILVPQDFALFYPFTSGESAQIRFKRGETYQQTLHHLRSDFFCLDLGVKKWLTSAALPLMEGGGAALAGKLPPSARSTAWSARVVRKFSTSGTGRAVGYTGGRTPP